MRAAWVAAAASAGVATRDEAGRGRMRAAWVAAAASAGVARRGGAGRERMRAAWVAAPASAGVQGGTRQAVSGCGRRWGAGLLALAMALVFACRDDVAPPPPSPIPDAEIAGLYAALTDGDTAAEEAAIARIEAAQD